MNKFISLILLAFIISSCTTDDTDKMTLTGTVKGLKKGTLYLQKINNSSLETVDSIIVHGNSDFKFIETIKSPEIYYLHIKIKDGILQDDRIAFFAEAKPITITTTLDKFSIDAVISGSENEEKFKEYNKLMNRYRYRNLELIEKNLTARKQGNDSLAQVYENSQISEMSRKYLATINFALNNSDYEIAPYLMVSHVKDAKRKYLDTVYNKLSPKIKDSKYGKALESLIASRKKDAQK